MKDLETKLDRERRRWIAVFILMVAVTIVRYAVY